MGLNNLYRMGQAQVVESGKHACDICYANDSKRYYFESDNVYCAKCARVLTDLRDGKSNIMACHKCQKIGKLCPGCAVVFGAYI
jgi:hypothetical protein